MNILRDGIYTTHDNEVFVVMQIYRYTVEIFKIDTTHIVKLNHDKIVEHVKELIKSPMFKYKSTEISKIKFENDVDGYLGQCKIF